MRAIRTVDAGYSCGRCGHFLRPAQALLVAVAGITRFRCRQFRSALRDCTRSVQEWRMVDSYISSVHFPSLTPSADL